MIELFFWLTFWPVDEMCVLYLRWSYIQSMNVTRSRVALVADMDRLWAIGGYDGMKNLSTVGFLEKIKLKLTSEMSQVEMYNPDTDSWSFVASMESHEGGVGVGVIPMVWCTQNHHLSVIPCGIMIYSSSAVRQLICFALVFEFSANKYAAHTEGSCSCCPLIQNWNCFVFFAKLQLGWICFIFSFSNSTDRPNDHPIKYSLGLVLPWPEKQSRWSQFLFYFQTGKGILQSLSNWSDFFKSKICVCFREFYHETYC